ncbi:hypothetical protein Fmac_026578 [Flemingia macrophylla]|uniref:Uncharacterized protein n=1 Tax=Flemingia macrophylla TaxID=520843 RepID=A0ABD1LFA5_9FABA
MRDNFLVEIQRLPPWEVYDYQLPQLERALPNFPFSSQITFKLSHSLSLKLSDALSVASLFCRKKRFRAISNYRLTTAVSSQVRNQHEGYTRNQLKIQQTSTIPRITGKRQITGNRWPSFNKECHIPFNYEANNVIA